MERGKKSYSAEALGRRSGWRVAKDLKLYSESDGEREGKMEMERDPPWPASNAFQHSACVSIRPWPFLFIIQHIITTGINKYLHTAASAPGRQM